MSQRMQEESVSLARTLLWLGSSSALLHENRRKPKEHEEQPKEPKRKPKGTKGKGTKGNQREPTYVFILGALILPSKRMISRAKQNPSRVAHPSTCSSAGLKRSIHRGSAAKLLMGHLLLVLEGQPMQMTNMFSSFPPNLHWPWQKALLQFSVAFRSPAQSD